MKRSRAYEDLVALETHFAPSSRLATKRNKTHAVVDLSDHAFSMGSLLTRTSSAEEELNLLLEANALNGYDRLTAGLRFDCTPFDDDDVCLAQIKPPRDFRSASLVEKEAREAKEALQFKKTIKHVDPLLQNSPDSTDSHFLRNCFESRSPVFDMSAFIMVLEPHAA